MSKSLLSEISFGSLLLYIPRTSLHGQSPFAEKARLMMLAVKDGRSYSALVPSALWALEMFAGALKTQVDAGKFPGYFDPGSTLVPMPRSSLWAEGSRWPALEICKVLKLKGLGGSHENYLERFIPLPKGNRVPLDHFGSMRVTQIAPTGKITVVDDVITSGAHNIAAVTLLKAAFPGVEIRAFAVARTEHPDKEPQTAVDPIEGTVTLQNEGRRAHRHP